MLSRTVHYKSDETVNFLRFRCANRFYQLRFLYLFTITAHHYVCAVYNMWCHCD